jgi:hypothetical protein
LRIDSSVCSSPSEKYDRTAIRGCPSPPARSHAALNAWIAPAAISGGAPPMVKPAPQRTARGAASSTCPPIIRGMRPLAVAGATGNGLGAGGSPAQASCSSSSSASSRFPRSGNVRPVSSKSSGLLPTPMPRVNRPPESWSRLAVTLASTTGS